MARYLTSVQRRARLRSRRSYTRGGRAGNRSGETLQCNIASHIDGERTARDVESQDLLETQRVDRMGALRNARMLQGRSLQLRARVAAALAATTISLKLLGNLQVSRARAGIRAPKGRQISRFPKVVGVPRRRLIQGPLTGRPVGAGGRIIPSAASRFGRGNKRRRLDRNLHTGPAQQAFFQPGEEGF